MEHIRKYIPTLFLENVFESKNTHKIPRINIIPFVEPYGSTNCNEEPCARKILFTVEFDGTFKYYGLDFQTGEEEFVLLVFYNVIKPKEFYEKFDVKKINTKEIAKNKIIPNTSVQDIFFRDLFRNVILNGVYVT